MRELIRPGWLIAAAVLLPILLFVAVHTGFAAREERRATEANAIARSETVTAAADAILSRTIGALDVLTTIRALPRGDVAGAYLRMRQVKALNPDWVTVTLTRVSDGVELIDLRRALGPGIARPRGPGLSSATRFERIDRGGALCPCVVIERAAPGTAGGYVVAVFLSTKVFERVLPAHRDEFELNAIATRQGNFVARSLAQAKRVGMPGSIHLRNAVRGGETSGIYHGVTLEGVENYTAFTRSRARG